MTADDCRIVDRDINAAAQEAGLQHANNSVVNRLSNENATTGQEDSFSYIAEVKRLLGLPMYV